MPRLANTTSLSSAILLFIVVVVNGQPRAESTPALIAKLACPDRVKDVAFSPDGKLLAAGYGWNNQGGARIWKTADNSVVATLTTGRGDAANVESIAFSPDGRRFAVANWDGDVMLWTVGSWGSRRLVLANRGSAKSLAFSPDSTKLVFSSETQAIIYDLRSGKTRVLATKTNERNSFISAVFAPDGTSVILFRDDVVQVVDLKTAKPINNWKPARAGFFGNVSADGNYVIAGGGAVYGRKSVEIWNIREQKKIGELTEFRSGLFALAISNSKRLFAVAGGNYGSGGDLSVWTLAEPRELGFVSFGEFPISGLAFSPDDKVLAAGSEDGFVVLYAVEQIRGPEVNKQDHPLCGEITKNAGKTFIVPLTKVPGPNRIGLGYAWQLEIVNPDFVSGLDEAPVALEDWSVESSADNDRVRIHKLTRLKTVTNVANGDSDHILFGDIQNPGWNAGLILKIYSDDTFVAVNNFGRCRAYGSLRQWDTDFQKVKKRLTGEGLLNIPKEPLTSDLAHFRTRFIGIASKGILELRTDAEVLDLSKSTKYPTKKQQAFTRIFELEKPFMDSILSSGMKAP